MSILSPSGPHETTTYSAGSKVSIIHDKLQGYVSSKDESPGAAIISELLQNADDAKAKKVRFRFCDDYLEVWNDSYFKPKDFANIQELMAAGKAEEQDTIGAFGTGFIATYHLTDGPHLLSMGRHIIFDPTKDRIPVYTSPVQQETIFRFPWRTTKTALAKKIGARIWKQADIEAVKSGIGPTLYRLSLFLRHVRLIEVYEGENRLLVRFERKRPSDSWQIGKITAERRLITYTEEHIQPVTDEWIYYKKHINYDLNLEDVTVKDDTVSIAFPGTSRPWLKRHVPASIYNFLPTAIHTDLAFQINGAFFPDNNRRGILFDQATQPEKAGWNERVIAEAGILFVEAVSDIRDRVDSVGRFYDLFPLTYRESVEQLQVIRETFVEALPNLEIIQSTCGSWLEPTKIILSGDKDLTRLATEYFDLLPKGVPQALQQALQDIGCEPINLDQVLRLLEPSLTSGIRLGQGNPHPMIDSRKKLGWLYGALKHALDSVADQDRGPLRTRIAKLAIFLAEDGRLYDGCLSDALWCGNTQARALDVTGIIRFVSRESQESFPLLRDILFDLSGSALLDNYIEPRLSTKSTLPITSPDLHVFMRGPDAFEQTLRFLAGDINEIDQESLHRLPLILDGCGMLHAASGAIRKPTDDSQELLESIGVPFVDAGFAKDALISRLYDKANVHTVRPEDVITALEQHYQHEAEVGDPGMPISSVDDLHELFEYLHRHVGKFPQKEAVPLVNRLSALAIFPTTGGRLVPASGQDPLMIPAQADTQSLDVPLNVLGLDVLIDPDLLHGNVADVLNQVFEIDKLTPLTLLENYVLVRYHDAELSHADRLALLSFMRNLYADPIQRPEMVRLLKTTGRGSLSLVRYGDDQNGDGHDASEPIYFDNSLTRAVLIDGFRRPHDQYDDGWKSFLRDLGVQRDPPVNTTAQRLLSLAAADEPPPTEIYAALATDWKSLSKDVQAQLRDKAIFWDGELYWAAEHVQLDEQEKFFGDRRVYRSHLQEEARDLLDKVPLQRAAMGWRDHWNMILEIAADYPHRAVVSADDRALLRANVAQINPVHWKDTLNGFANIAQALPTLPIVLTTTGHLRAVAGHTKSLMIAAGPGAKDSIPTELLDQVELVDSEYAVAGSHLLRVLLGIQELLPYHVAQTTFARVYTACKDTDHETCFKLLSFLRGLWNDLSIPQQKELLAHLSQVKLIRADDDHYYPPEMISFDSAELDDVFMKGPYRPRRPHTSYRIPKRPNDRDVKTWNQSPWVELFSHLGIHTRPAPTDILTAVKAVIVRNTRPSPADSQAIEPIYNWLRSNISEIDKKGSDELLKPLSELAWLPANHADVWSWYKPAQVYARDDRALIGNLAPVLPFTEPNAGLQEQLGFPKEPPVAIVAKHLLVLGQTRPTEEPGSLRRIYPFLSKRWGELDSLYQERLKQEPVIWYGGRFWPRQKTLFFPNSIDGRDLQRLFGHRRALIQRSSDSQEFFSLVCVSYDSLQSHILLLREIAAEYAGSQQLRNEDHALLIGNFNYLGREQRDEQIDNDMKSLAMIPGSDRTLHRWDSVVLADPSQSDLLRRFQKTNLVVVAEDVHLDTSHGAEHSFPESDKVLSLTENGYRFLRALEVGLLSLDPKICTRQLISVCNPIVDTDLTNRIQSLVGPFRRIRHTLEDQGKRIATQAPLPDQLEHTRFINCDQMTVQYVIKLPSGDTIEAPSSSGELALFKYDEATNQPVLYTQGWKKESVRIAAAVDLNFVFFPGEDKSSLIERLLGFKTLAKANDYLSLLHYRGERPGEEPPVIDDEAWDDETDHDEVADTEEVPAEDDNLPSEAMSEQSAGVVEPISVAPVTRTTHEERPAYSPGSHTPAQVNQSPTTPESRSTTSGVPPRPAPVATPLQPIKAPLPVSTTPPVRSTPIVAPTPPFVSQPQANPAPPQPRHPGTQTAASGEWHPVCLPEEASLPDPSFRPESRPTQATSVTRRHKDDVARHNKETLHRQAESDVESQMSQESRQRIGDWGERYVMRYLQNEWQKQHPNASLSVTGEGFSLSQNGNVLISVRLLNTTEEVAVGCDIELQEGSTKHHIEVKATTEQQKEWFQISRRQWEFAREHGPRFHIYWVFNAGTPQPGVQIITDPVACWHRGELIVDSLRIRIA